MVCRSFSGGDAVGDGDEGAFEADPGDLDVIRVRASCEQCAQCDVGVAAAQLHAVAVHVR
jgi:hypothetical protein